jgi:hypothetical protein
VQDEGPLVWPKVLYDKTNVPSDNAMFRTVSAIVLSDTAVGAVVETIGASGRAIGNLVRKKAALCA